MLVAVFPDTRSVLLQRRVARPDDERTEHKAPYEIPSAEVLRDLGLSLPSDLWRFAQRSDVPVSGVFLQSSILEHLVTRQADRESGLAVVSRRKAADLMDIDDYWYMNRAYHLAEWDRRTQFCGSCAAPMDRAEGEIAKLCPSCGHRSYPQIAPAVIMAIVKDGKLLVAHNSRHPGRLFSVLAGFVEPGETLEHAVSREVHEEAGILVRNVEYFSSQPWPFPNSLMVAFTAEYAGGELHRRDGELEEVGWFSPSEIPGEIPSSYSVARRLIEWFVSEYGTAQDLQRVLAAGLTGETQTKPEQS